MTLAEVGAVSAALYLAAEPNAALLVFALFVAFPCVLGLVFLVYLVSEIIHARA